RMKYIVLLLALSMLLLISACSNKEDKLTAVDINSLNIPQDFDYDMSRNVSINLQGAFHLPVTIASKDGNVLLRTMMNPETGLQTKLTFPSSIKQVVLKYQRHEVTVNVSPNGIAYNFPN
ncbi:MAG: hypothetical protein U1C33_08560, partial [Candidatus Cloacimonadaceae bacterium]|nr:hypothetical protein [Candidatus Cloacimonadaceae bacterium]